MKAKKVLGVLVAVSMVGAMMTGCGDKAEGTNVNTADTASEATTEAGTETVEVTEIIETTEVETAENTEAESAKVGVEIAAGTYAGSYTKEAMGSEIVYEYTLALNEDGTYNYHVSFEMGGKTYPEEETGTYTTEGNIITLTSAAPLKESDASIIVTSAEAGNIQFSRCVSSFASEQVALEAVLAE